MGGPDGSSTAPQGTASILILPVQIGPSNLVDIHRSRLCIHFIGHGATMGPIIFSPGTCCNSIRSMVDYKTGAYPRWKEEEGEKIRRKKIKALLPRW